VLPFDPVAADASIEAANQTALIYGVPYLMLLAHRSLREGIQGTNPTRKLPRVVDPITVSVITHRFEAIVQEMGEAMLRTAYSQILNSSRDFSTAIADRDARLVAQAEHVPIHVGSLPWAVKAITDAFDGEVRPGDVYLLNDPYHGGNHLPDLTTFVPVFHDGALMFWSINRSHQSDIGGAAHGAYNPAATEIWQEGVRIPPLRIHDAGIVRDDVIAMIASNVRHPDDFLGDLRAMIGSARVGERRMLQMLEEYGPEVIVDSIDVILDSAERETRACIAGWKDGVFKGEAVLDDDGHGNENIHIRATVTVAGDALTVDLSDSDPQVTGFVNSSYPNMMSAVYMALTFLIEPRTPKNSGTFRAVEVIAQEGTVVWAMPPAPVTLSTNHCAQEISEAVVKALAMSCPDRVYAGWGRRFRIAIKGINPRTGRQFIWHLFHARPGAGASAGGDGWETAGEGQAMGSSKFGSVEVAEARFPLFFENHEFRPDSFGDGKFRGGAGSVLRLVMETTEVAVANTAGDGTRHPSFGTLGGCDGLPHRYRLAADGAERELRTKEVDIAVPPGAVFLIESAGGGGYGPSDERSSQAREADRLDGFTQIDAAAKSVLEQGV
jgi:N-methylhydantoinase B